MGETTLVPGPRRPLPIELDRFECEARVENLQAVLDALLAWE